MDQLILQNQYDDLPLNYRFSFLKAISTGQLMPEFPVHVQMDLVGACNNKCPFCFFRDGADNLDMDRDPIRRKSLATDLVLGALHDFKSVGVKAITLTGGGESLLHKDINIILKTIFDLGFELGVMSNLNLMPSTDLLKKALWIRVSLDAASKDTYQKIHAPGGGISFDDVVNNMRFLAPHVDLGISFLICRSNWHEIAQVAELAARIGVSYVQYKLVYDQDKSQSLFAKREDIYRLLDQAKEIASRSFKKLEIIDLLGRISLIEKSPRNYRQCYIHRHTAIVGADAQMYLCCLLKYIPQFSLGSLQTASFQEIWAGAKRKGIIHGFNKDKCPPCFYEKTNEAIDYLLSKDNPHKNFV